MDVAVVPALPYILLTDATAPAKINADAMPADESTTLLNSPVAPKLSQ